MEPRNEQDRERKPTETKERQQPRVLTPDVEPREMVHVPAPQPEVIGNGHIDALQVVEDRARSIGRIRELAIRSTVPEHWTNQGDKPYLTSAGAQAAARICGVKVTNVSVRREEHRDKDGSYYEFVFTGTFSLPGTLDRIEGVEGSCTSRDDLLGTGGKKTIEEVDPGDVRKKAQTNLLQRGITQILGLRGLEWSTLAKFGITPEGAAKVEYETGAKGGGQKGEFSFKFGKQKGVPISQLEEKDLGWYLKISKEDAASDDPKKQKYKANSEKQVKIIEEELARRANEKAGAKGAPANGPSLWTRIQTLANDYEFPRGDKDADLIGFVKSVTGNKPGKDLTEDDFKKIEAAMSAEVARMNEADDFPY